MADSFPTKFGVAIIVASVAGISKEAFVNVNNKWIRLAGAPDATDGPHLTKALHLLRALLANWLVVANRICKKIEYLFVAGVPIPCGLKINRLATVAANVVFFKKCIIDVCHTP